MGRHARVVLRVDSRAIGNSILATFQPPRLAIYVAADWRNGRTLPIEAAADVGHPLIDLRKTNIVRASLSPGERTRSMSLIQTCKCEECDMQKSFANHWVMLYERNGNLVILPKWDEKMIRRTRHFCGRAHASRYVERWIAGLAMAAMSDGIAGFEPHKIAPAQSFLDAEDESMAAELIARYG